MATQQEEGWRRVARELAALGLWALAFFALLSLVSHDARYDPNFGGALGGATGTMVAAALPGNFSGANLIVLLAIVGALALLGGRAPTEIAVSSNSALARSRPSSRAKRRDDSMLHRVPEVNPAPSLGGSRGGADAPPRTVKPPLILL